MALAAACAMPVAGLAMIAAPWRFAGFSDRARGDIASLWQSAEPACAALGLVPMEVLQTGFWRLDPGRTSAKYERFGRLDPDSEAARTRSDARPLATECASPFRSRCSPYT